VSKAKSKMEKPHKKFDVWQLAMDFAIEIYKITDPDELPRSKLRGI